MLLMSCQLVVLFSCYGLYSGGRKGLFFLTLKHLEEFQVRYSMNVNQPLLSHFCLRHLADSQGESEEVQPFAEEGVCALLCLSSVICFHLCFTPEDKEMDFHMPDW